jgi:membrane protease YdiL (CAAX protease family)
VQINGKLYLGALGCFVVGVIFGVIRWRAGGIVGLILIHGLLDVIAEEMTPTLTIKQISQVHIVHPALGILSDALLLAVVIYLWKFHPAIDE